MGSISATKTSNKKTNKKCTMTRTIFNNTIFLTQQQDSLFVGIAGKKFDSGSSSTLQYMMHLPTNSLWVCKCSVRGVLSQYLDGNPKDPPTDSIDDFKEALALLITPQVVLSKQPLSKKAQDFYQKNIMKPILTKFPMLKSKLGLNIPRIHVMSRYLQNYNALGIHFFQKYVSQANRQAHFYEVTEGVPLVGFGKALALSMFLYDYDCIGNSGNNMGYVIVESRAHIIKIDAGEALPFQKSTATATNRYPPSIINPQNKFQYFDQKP